jgi:glycosyltransferase involved in cell wall biosynthesis
MNILIIAPFFPLPLDSGGHTRLFNIIKYLSRRHTIDFISPFTNHSCEYVPQMKQYCRNIALINIEEFVNKTSMRKNIQRLFQRFCMLVMGIPLEASGFYFYSLRDKLDEILNNNKYDVVQVEYPRMALHLRPEFYTRNSFIKVIVDYDLSFVTPWRQYCNEKRWLRRQLYYANYFLQKNFALSTWQRFDRMVVMSEVDKKKVKETAPYQDVCVVPNGVDLENFKMINRCETSPLLIMLGGTSHWANIDAYKYFTEEIFSRVTQLVPRISLRVVGSGWDKYSQSAADPAITFPGFADDLRSLFTGSTVLIAPIRVGGGTRLKILEAMAMGVPVVSTTVGCEGIEVIDGVHLLKADTPELFAEQIKKIFIDKSLCQKLITNARALVEEKYGWHKLAMLMEKVYDKPK